MSERKTAGEQSIKAASDNTKYDPLEVGHALCDDIVPNLFKCAHDVKDKFGEDEYFIILLLAGDPLIKGVRRHKYYAYLYLPSPRPEQAVFLYNKITDKMKRLWSLPKAETMALLSEEKYVAKQWQQTKGWVDAFYKLNFWEHIRKEHGIKHLSEHEYLKLHREELIKAGAKDCPPSVPDAFNFSKIQPDHIIDTQTSHI